MLKKTLIKLLLVFLTSILLFFIFKPVFFAPNELLFGKTIDPIKSYFNFGYYLKYDDGIKHDGINYPYGDHLQYINSHPGFATVLKFIDKHLFPVAESGVAFLNLAMILSFIPGILLLYLILVHYKLPDWYAIISALLIGFLTPQFDRIHGHFEMVHWYFIPLFWYLLILFRENKKKVLWGLLLVLSGITGGFISAYFVAFYAILLLAVLLSEIGLSRDHWKLRIKKAWPLLILTIIPLVVIKGVVGLTDWVTDRPSNPYGFYVYYATPASIFCPSNYPFKSLFPTHYQWEGRAFVGLPATIIAIILLVSFILSFITRKKTTIKIFFQEHQLKIYLLAGTLILLFSMCFPFKRGFGFLTDLLPPLKQFRALGRFSWIFFYIFSIYTAWGIYQVASGLWSKLHRLFAGILIVTYFILTGYASIANINRGTKNLFQNNDKLEKSDQEYKRRFEETDIDYHQFQAILSLPFSSTNGDKLLFENGLTALTEAMKCSYHTGIPLIQSFSPRLSFKQSLSSIQLLADPAIRKTRLDDMNEKPLLLLCTKQQLSPNEENLKKHATVFWKDQYISLSLLPVTVFKQEHERWLNETHDFLQQFNDTQKVCSTIPNSDFIYKNFENCPSEHSFTGKGAISKKKGELELFNGKLPLDSCFFELSFWLYFDTRCYDMPQAILATLNHQDEIVNQQKLNTRQVHDIFGDWVRISSFVKPQPNFRYRLFLKGQYLFADDLLIRPTDSPIFIRYKKGLSLMDNYPFIE